MPTRETLKVDCGRCLRTLGRLDWPTDTPTSELDTWDWLWGNRLPAEDQMRNPIREAHTGEARIKLTNPAALSFRLDTNCRCGHRGRVRLQKIPAHTSGGTLTVP